MAASSGRLSQQVIDSSSGMERSPEQIAHETAPHEVEETSCRGDSR